ncbi:MULTISPECIES: hypothetical protein [Chryseobacterium]|uniref:Uncharacterized protein n=1 Tax=Candidatus Chryseobacterium massiliense TaxID=204089 RepID=A0A3D9BAR9_9FLAO|nr:MULTISPECIES: hypothetical protein [Chryseobacterium]REC50695.1 hypothetical protein DRF68_08305 [Candidatus Chryseobacterium massiliae]HCR75127.1 hypothetical protein [Chryseobacterium sp.]
MKTLFAFIIINIVFFTVGCFISYFVFDYFNPPVTEDGHPVMPIGNAIYSVVTSFVLTILLFILIRKYIAEKF